MTLDKIQAYLKTFDIELHINKEFSSNQVQHRQAIRHAISNITGEDVTDLNQLPRLNRHFVSISHSQHCGGFVLSKKPVGLDIEEKKRLHLKVIQRISSDKEIALAPNPLFLWVVKESIFKKCSNKTVIGEIQIVDWKRNDFCWLAYAETGESAALFELETSFIAVSF